MPMLSFFVSRCKLVGMSSKELAALASRYAKTIALNVWVCRKASELTQAELARAVGCSVPAVSRLEAGQHLPSLTTLLKLATALGVTPCRLLEEAKEDSVVVKPKGR